MPISMTRATAPRRLVCTPTRAPALQNHTAVDNLRLALRFLDQPQPPSSLHTAEELLRWATLHWSLARVPARMAITIDSLSR